MMKDLYLGIPLFCLGLSMGALTGYLLSLKHRELFSGSIMMAPAFKNLAPGWRKMTIKIFRVILPQKIRFAPQARSLGNKNPGISAERKNDIFITDDRH
jgi:alpha-beta hydrolase superfamily lysophospholipase